MPEICASGLAVSALLLKEVVLIHDESLQMLAQVYFCPRHCGTLEDSQRGCFFSPAPLNFPKILATVSSGKILSYLKTVHDMMIIEWCF